MFVLPQISETAFIRRCNSERYNSAPVLPDASICAFLKIRKPLIRLGAATVHGVVFRFLMGWVPETAFLQSGIL